MGRLKEDEERWRGERSPGRKGASQLPSADANKARLNIGLLLQGQLYHHLQEGENSAQLEEDIIHLLLVQTDHLTSRAKQGATLEEVNGGGISPGG